MAIPELCSTGFHVPWVSSLLPQLVIAFVIVFEKSHNNKQGDVRDNGRGERKIVAGMKNDVLALRILKVYVSPGPDLEERKKEERKKRRGEGEGVGLSSSSSSLSLSLPCPWLSRCAVAVLRLSLLIPSLLPIPDLVPRVFRA